MIHICLIIIGCVGLQPTEYNVHKYVVSIPWAQHVRTEEAVAQRDDDRPFIVLTETKFSFRCIPVWIGTLLTGLGSKKKHM